MFNRVINGKEYTFCVGDKEFSDYPDVNISVRMLQNLKDHPARRYVRGKKRILWIVEIWFEEILYQKPVRTKSKSTRKKKPIVPKILTVEDFEVIEGGIR